MRFFVIYDHYDYRGNREKIYTPGKPGVIVETNDEIKTVEDLHKIVRDAIWQKDCDLAKQHEYPYFSIENFAKTSIRIRNMTRIDT